MKISTKGRYALDALFYIAMQGENGTVKIKEICNYNQVSQRYLEQIFFKLRKAGLLQTVRGKYGGYCLQKMPSEITVGQILEAVEGQMVPVACVHSVCPVKLEEFCMTKQIWCHISGAITDIIGKYTLEDLVKGYRDENIDKR